MTDLIIVEQPTSTIITTISGPAGPPGPVGAYLVYEQIAPASDWVIDHNLGQYLNISVLLNGEVVDADIVHNSVNQITVHFSAPQTGKVVFS